MRILLPVYALLLSVFAAGVLLVVKTGIDDYVSSHSLAGMQIEPPDGWSVRPYQPVDGHLITQPADDPDELIGTTAQILDMFDMPTGGLHEGAAKTFSRGTEMIALRLQTAPHTPKRIYLMDRLGRKTNEEADDPNAVFATVAGLPLVAHPRLSYVADDVAPRPVNYRYFTMVIGDQTVDDVLEVSLLTNSSDAALVAVLNNLDMRNLNARIPTPDPRVIPAAGVLTRDALPLSDQPPRPTPAYRAMELMAAGEVFDAPWQDALTRVRHGEITSWDGLQARYPQIDTIPYALLEVLDDGSRISTARYYATILSNSGRAWSGHEFHVLWTIAEAGTTQADVAEYLAGEFEIAPEVIALAQRLPVAAGVAAPETQVVQSGTAPTVGLRSAGNCVLDNGVRRCVIGTN